MLERRTALSKKDVSKKKPFWFGHAGRRRGRKSLTTGGGKEDTYDTQWARGTEKERGGLKVLTTTGEQDVEGTSLETQNSGLGRTSKL